MSALSWLNNLVVIDPKESDEISKTLKVERAILKKGALTVDGVVEETGLDRTDVLEICTRLHAQDRVQRQPVIYYIK